MKLLQKHVFTSLLFTSLGCTSLIAENPNLSFSKFSEALKKGKSSLGTKIENLDEPWEDQLKRAPGQRQPAQLGQTSKNIELQAVKYQNQVLMKEAKEKTKAAEPKVESQKNSTPKITPPKSKQPEKKQEVKKEPTKPTQPQEVEKAPATETRKSTRGRTLSERYQSLSDPQTKNTGTPIKQLKLPAESPQPQAKTKAVPEKKAKSTLNIQVLKEAPQAKKEKQEQTRRVQETETPPTKIKNLTY